MLSSIHGAKCVFESDLMTKKYESLSDFKLDVVVVGCLSSNVCSVAEDYHNNIQDAQGRDKSKRHCK